VFKRIGRPMFLHEALHILALAQALADSATEAGKSLQELDALELPPTMYDAADLLQARAWAAVADGHIPKATSFLEQAIELATSIGDLVVAASTLHDMARLGKPKVVVDRLEDLAGEVETELVAVRAAHVRCLIANDAEGLSEVSSSFAEFGADLLAADSAADAAVAWTKLGHHRAAAASTRKAIEFVDRCEGASTPAVRSIDARARLTPAERETATLAAAGYSNKYIAKELVLSVRSIENRLQHVYDKLGINGRDELAEALNLNHSPSSD
jgi:DNA-binding CsgD family transcriptional regulator